MQSLKVFRKINGITQQDLATYLGTTKGFISQVENGISKFPIHLLNKIYENTNGWNTSCLPSINENPLSSSPQEVPVVVEEVTKEVPLAIPIIPPTIVDNPNISIRKDMLKNVSDYEKFDLRELGEYVDSAYRVRTEKLAPHINIGDIIFIKRLLEGQDIHDGDACVVDSTNLGGLIRYVFNEGDNLRLVATNRYPDILLPKEKVEDVWQIVGRYTPGISMPDYLSNKIINQQGEQISSLLNSVNLLVTATVDEGKRTDRVLDLLENEMKKK